MRRLVRGLHRPHAPTLGAVQVDRPAERLRSDGDEVLHRPALAQVSEERDQRTRQLQRPCRAGGLSVTTPRLIRPQELLLWDRLGAQVLRRQVPLPLLSVGRMSVQRGGLIGHLHANTFTNTLRRGPELEVARRRVVTDVSLSRRLASTQCFRRRRASSCAASSCAARCVSSLFSDARLAALRRVLLAVCPLLAKRSS